MQIVDYMYNTTLTLSLFKENAIKKSICTIMLNDKLTKTDQLMGRLDKNRIIY